MMRPAGTNWIARIVAPGMAVVAAVLAPSLACGQSSDTRVVTPGPQYAATRFEEVFLGTSYRDQWTTPIRVDVLDLGRYAGGLRPTRLSGGRQTKSLRFEGADGKEYAFRSLIKIPEMADEPALRNTAIGDIIWDQSSSIHIGGQFAAPVMLDALGVMHVTPRLFVMPDDPRLGPFRQQFAGMLGTVEERINDQESEKPGFGGFTRILETEDLLDRLEDSSRNRVDAREYLTARLFDLLVNDWDRHEDQWRWAAVDSAGVRWWLPIPRDRDFVFVDYDGYALALLRQIARNTVAFSPDIREVYGLTLNGRAIDRRVLAGLDRAVWDSVAASVQARITDDVLDRAMQRMPPEIRALSGRWTVERLRSRRADLPAAAERFYRLLASDVDVHATDQRDVAVIDRMADGALRVRLYDADQDGSPAGSPYYDRRFIRNETIEVRVFMHGGDDRVVVRGEAPRGLTVRVIGGNGDDLLADSSRVDKGKTVFYDDRGANRFIRGPVTRVDEKPYEAPDVPRNISGETFRDYGGGAFIAPTLRWRGEDGPILGAAWGYKRFGFRKFPYAWLFSAGVEIGTLSGAVATELRLDERKQNSRDGRTLRFRASQLESIRFYGFGNDTPSPEPTRFFVVRRDELLAQAEYHLGLPWGAIASVGPLAKLGRNEQPVGTPFTTDGVGERNTEQLGGLLEFRIDRRNPIVFPRHGVYAVAGVTGYPLVGSESGAFAEAHATASAYWTLGRGLAPTLAARAGAKKLWGDFPVHESAFLGGSRTIRGYPYQRYAGDAMAFGNAEIRQPFGTVNLLVRGTLGMTVLADAGRVYFSDEDSDTWHGALGGGLWFHFTIRNTPLGASATLAHGEDSIVYFKLGAPF